MFPHDAAHDALFPSPLWGGVRGGGGASGTIGATRTTPHPNPPPQGGREKRFARRHFLHIAAGAIAWPTAARLAQAQTYPTRPVRAVVAFAPGGTTDTFARIMAQKLSENFGRQFYVENIAGATGNIGTGQVAKAAPDGHTLLFAFSSYVVNPTLFDKIPYDPIKDFETVSLAVASTSVLTVNPSVGQRQ